MKRILTFGAVLLVAIAIACTAEKTSPNDTTSLVEAPRVRGAFDIDVTGIKMVDLAVPTDTGVASARFAAVKPGFAFTIAGINTFARTRSGTLAGSVKIGSRIVVSSLNFGIDSIKAMTLLADSVQGTANDTINVFMATTAAGTVKQGHVILQLKPRY
jgi:hypothetical protein